MASGVSITGPNRKGVPISANVRFQKSIASRVTGNLGSSAGATTTIAGTFVHPLVCTQTRTAEDGVSTPQAEARNKSSVPKTCLRGTGHLLWMAFNFSRSQKFWPARRALTTRSAAPRLVPSGLVLDVFASPELSLI